MLYETIQDNEENIVKNQFIDIMNQNASLVVKQINDQINEVFGETKLQDEEKTTFSNAQTEIRRNMDIELKVYKEWLDVQANKNLTQLYQNSLK